jgi:hypothetical protein
MLEKNKKIKIHQNVKSKCHLMETGYQLQREAFITPKSFSKRAASEFVFVLTGIRTKNQNDSSVTSFLVNEQGSQQSQDLLAAQKI